MYITTMNIKNVSFEFKALIYIPISNNKKISEMFPTMESYLYIVSENDQYKKYECYFINMHEMSNFALFYHDIIQEYSISISVPIVGKKNYNYFVLDGIKDFTEKYIQTSNQKRCTEMFNDVFNVQIVNNDDQKKIHIDIKLNRETDVFEVSNQKFDVVIEYLSYTSSLFSEIVNIKLQNVLRVYHEIEEKNDVFTSVRI